MFGTKRALLIFFIGISIWLLNSYKKSTIIDETVPGGATVIEGFAVFKSKHRWNTTSSSWSDPATDSDDTTFEDEKINGEIIEVNEEGIVVEYKVRIKEGKKKRTEMMQTPIAFNKIKKAKIRFLFSK